MSDTEQKICTLCKTLKNISTFRKDSRLKSGVGATCKSCSTQRASIWNKNNAAKVKERERLWRQSNKSYDTERKIAWAKAHPENKKAADKKAYEKNKQKRYAVSEQWRINNRDYIRAKNKERHAVKLQRLPKWLTLEDKQYMQNLYAEARRLSIESGVVHHVDHEIPLQGALVSGLHTPSNLRIVTATENLKKRNKYTP